MYRPSELFSHLMNSLQDGLPLWMQSFSFRVTTGHIRHNKHLPPVLFFLVSAGRGTATSEDIISPCVELLVFFLLARFIKEVYEFLLSIKDLFFDKWKGRLETRSVMFWLLSLSL